MPLKALSTRVAGDTAKFGVSEARWSLYPMAGSAVRLRRQIHVELSREKITALNLSVDRIVQMLRQENQNTPLGEVMQGDATYLVRNRGQFNNLDDIRNLQSITNGRIRQRSTSEQRDPGNDRPRQNPGPRLAPKRKPAPEGAGSSTSILSLPISCACGASWPGSCHRPACRLPS